MFRYCSVGSGSSGNCHYVGYKNTNLLIDAGLSGKRIETNLAKADIDIKTVKGILITHEHSDHIKGAGILSRKHDIPIYTNKNTWESMKDKIGNVKEHNIKIFESNTQFEIEDVVIKSFSIDHDAAEPVAYSFYNGKEKISIATDLGCINNNIRENLFDSKLVVLESNYDENMLMMGSYPYYLKRRVLSNKGHLSNEDAAKFCTELINKGTQTILLAHLSKENNFPELAYETSKGILSENNIKVDKDVKLKVLLREELSELYAV
jgi:phosphoribosyl 1,2-cyclic phosphodiesterase